MSLSILIPFWLVWLAGVATPGPNFFVVTRNAASQGRRAGLAAAAGVAVGAVFWALVGLFGIKLVFAAFPWAWTLVKLIGALYLVFVGIQLWRNASVEVQSSIAPTRRAFTAGLLINLFNPKAAAFAASLFAVAIPENAPAAVTFAAFVLIVLTSWIWYSACAIMVSHSKIRFAYDRFKVGLARIASVIFIGFGVQLALED